MNNSDATTADPSRPDNQDGVDLLVIDKRGRQRRWAVDSAWGEIPVLQSTSAEQSNSEISSTGITEKFADENAETTVRAATEPEAQDIHHIAMHMGSVIAKPVAGSVEFETESDAAAAASDDRAVEATGRATSEETGPAARAGSDTPPYPVTNATENADPPVNTEH